MKTPPAKATLEKPGSGGLRPPGVSAGDFGGRRPLLQKPGFAGAARTWQIAVGGALVAVTFLSGDARAGETNLFGAHMQQPAIAVSSESNGVLELTCKVGFIGGCCFPLTSHDVTASLDLSAGLSVLSGPEPAGYESIVAPPSGTPQAWATFKWRLRRSSPDAGKSFTAIVSSPGSGQVQATYSFDRQTRISVGGPRLPDRLASDQALEISVDAVSQDPNRYVKRVRFWYSTDVPAGAEPVEPTPDLAARGILQFKLAGKLRPVQGQFIDLARKYEPTVWHGTVPGHPGPLRGVALAIDDTGRTASGPMVRSAGPVSAGQPNVASTRWVGIGFFLTLVGCVSFALLPRRNALAVAGVALLIAVAIGFVWVRSPSARPTDDGAGYPVNASTVAYLFLDGGEESRQLAERMETYRLAAPHRIHLLCFVEGITPAPILNDQRARLHVTRLPSVVFDNHALVDGSDLAAIHGTLDRCYEKPTPRLSMELHGGWIAGHQLSLGFIMCNHAARQDAHGSVSAFAFENGVLANGWRCDHVVRASLLENRRYAIPVGKCQAPALMQWKAPAGVDSGKTGALTVILDRQGRLIDSICTERPCSRTGICG
jgi:hypothetical protein